MHWPTSEMKTLQKLSFLFVILIVSSTVSTCVVCRSGPQSEKIISSLIPPLKIPDLRYTVKLEWCPHYRGEIEVHLILGVLLYCNAYIGPRAYQPTEGHAIC